MQNEKKFLGKALAYLYPSFSGKTQSTMTLDEVNIAQLLSSIQKSGPGSKIRLKPTSEKFRAEKVASLRSQGKKGNAPEYIVEIISASELEEEKKILDAKNALTSGDGAL